MSEALVKLGEECRGFNRIDQPLERQNHTFTRNAGRHHLAHPYLPTHWFHSGQELVRGGYPRKCMNLPRQRDLGCPALGARPLSRPPPHCSGSVCILGSVDVTRHGAGPGRGRSAVRAGKLPAPCCASVFADVRRACDMRLSISSTPSRVERFTRRWREKKLRDDAGPAHTWSVGRR